jgi:MFS transporter, OFA family, oxalate/formate antiporter
MFVRVVGFYTPSVLARSTASRAFTTIRMLATLGLLGVVFRVLSNSPLMAAPKTQTKLFYGWYIVAVGFLSHVACAFHMSSTLSVFLKPLTEDLSVSRGLFSLLRSGEILIGAGMAPLIGPLVDRYGGRWLMAGGALVAGSGFVLLSQVSSFWQFLALRWILITIGGVFMCHMVVSVTISRWFVRRRGRAIALASLGQGASKVCIPLVTASLFVWVGWRGTWSIFGVITLVLIVIPALILMRRSPEDMGLKPDGDEPPPDSGRDGAVARRRISPSEEVSEDVIWTGPEVIRTNTFWIVCFIYGMANVGIAGLNLHVFAYVTDIGFSTLVGATVLSIIASMQLGSTLIWGFLSERMQIRHSSMLMFLVQAIGLGLAIATSEVLVLYIGFTLYGVGLGGGWVLQELVWANYFGRLSLGKVRGLGILVTHAFGAAGAPFFGYVHDATGSYNSSFLAFVVALAICALLSLAVRAPRKGSSENRRLTGDNDTA